MGKQDIIQYYQEAHISYVQGWDLKHSLAMHMGYFDKANKNLRAALKRMNEVIAELSEVKPGDVVLDAGCGVGGSAIYLAKEKACKVVGITLSGFQKKKADQFALQHGVAHNVTFEVQDYESTSFPNETFDVVWAAESVCHSEDASKFANEAYRLLKPNGRLVVADYYKAREPEGSAEKKDFEFFLDAVACPKKLESPSSFVQKLEMAGFSNCEDKNATHNVLPLIPRLRFLGISSSLVTSVLKFLGIRRSKARENGGEAVLATIRMFEKGVVEYHLFSARKVASY
jgi:tocopherol O-methyltransferase